jgi:hypothetical protein
VSHAIAVEQKDILHPDVRDMVQREWDRVRPIMRGLPPRTAPTITRFATGMLTPRLFKKPVVFWIPKNSMVIFVDAALFEVRLEMRGNSSWRRDGTVIAVKDMDAVVRPLTAAVRTAAESAAESEKEEVLIWIEMGLDCDFGTYFPTAG